MIICYKTHSNEEEIIENVYDTCMNYFVLHDIGIDVTMVGLDAIRKLNLEHRKVDSVTDVLSFPAIDVKNIRKLKKENYPLDVDPETGDLYLGELFISRKVAELQAKKMNHSYDIELAFLALHGMLHLLGFDHIKPEDRAEMREKENILMRVLGYPPYAYED